jgi:hypothetical protein
MSKSDFLENAILKLIFNATAIANIADNAASSPLTNLYWSLHTADPGDAGNQSTSETAYGLYARQPVARTTGGMTAASAGSTSPVANVVFPAANSPSLPSVSSITHAGIGVAVSGATNLLYSGPVTPNINVSVGVQPILTTASTVTED